VNCALDIQYDDMTCGRSLKVGCKKGRRDMINDLPMKVDVFIDYT